MMEAVYKWDDPRRRRRITRGVIGVHALLVLLAAISFRQSRFVVPSPRAIRVRVAPRREPADVPSREQRPAPRPAPQPAARPAPKTSRPAKPVPPRRTSHRPKSERPKATSAPAARKQRKRPPPRTVSRHTWKPRSPEEIRRSARLASTSVRPRPTPFPTHPQTPVPTAEAIARRLENKVRGVRVSRIGTPMVSAGETARQNDYFDAVAAWLHKRWNQPDRAEAGPGNPSVKVELTVRRDGSVVSARITGPSGNAAMDASVAALLEGLKRLPAPSGYGVRTRQLTFGVRFELED